VGRKPEAWLAIQPRTISVLGPAGFHTPQPKESNFTCKKRGEDIPSILPANTLKGLESNEELPLWKGKLGMGQSGLYFLDTYLILSPISSFKKHLP